MRDRGRVPHSASLTQAVQRFKFSIQQLVQGAVVPRASRLQRLRLFMARLWALQARTTAECMVAWKGVIFSILDDTMTMMSLA